MTIIFAIATIICAIGWFNQYVATLAIVYYMQKKEYTPPNAEEVKEGTLFALKHLFK